MKSFPKFFTRQLLGFIALAFLIITIDLFLYIQIALHESEAGTADGTPVSTISQVSDQLQPTEGGYALGDGAAAMLDQNQAWALLVGQDGKLLWNRGAPAEAVHDYTIDEVALLGHYGYLYDYPSFIWARDDGLLVLGYPQGSYAMYSVNAIPHETALRIPGYIMLVFFVDLVIFFIAYMLSKRRTVANIAPITDAIEKLSTGQKVQIDLKGDLQEVGERINETSAIIQKKDTARDSWIRGVSHDIRTPLSMITGYADAIANDGSLPEKTRDDAAVVRAQGMKIKDLVLDLNVASRLDYDMQPLAVSMVSMAKMLRSIVAEYLNGALPKGYGLELFVEERAQDMVANADERLLARAVQNLIQNAIIHNPQGCKITIMLAVKTASGKDFGFIRVADNGVGLSATDLVVLQNGLYQARIAADGSAPNVESHGLGLVLVEKIVRAHGGVMQIDAKPQEGFSAELSLPMWHQMQGPAGFSSATMAQP